MIIAVIGGTGVEGSGLALRLAKAGHRVAIGSRDPAKAKLIAAELGQKIAGAKIEGDRNDAAAAAAEVVILTVPYAAQRATVDEIRGALAGKILVDATAPLVPPRVNRVQLPPGGSAVATIQSLLGDTTRVVSAFQNVAAEKLRQLDHPVDCDVLVCADDATARQVVIDLIASMGLRGIDAGPLCNSAAAEALTSVLIWINRKYKVPGAGIRITGLDA
ncbi:MAG TPA: NADPH-dependent F420 reductase [Stellaceae bacterium]|jgi:NADPH-dependent F420 reductase|nr:NADPH-dependent F420 reductase [Stellaceae bacterium]